MSVNSTNPGTLFGGTWTQLKDRFLLGAGTSYTNGTTGGTTSNTLVETNLPRINLKFKWGREGGAQGWGMFTSSAIYTNGSTNNSDVEIGTTWNSNPQTAINNMPPYLVVYMWKRTA